MKGDPEERAIAVGRYIAGTGATVRAAAVVFGVSKSTIWKDQARLRRTSPGLWAEVQAVVQKNKAERHLRGGEAAWKRRLERKWKNGGQSVGVVLTAVGWTFTGCFGIAALVLGILTAVGAGTLGLTPDEFVALPILTAVFYPVTLGFLFMAIVGMKKLSYFGRLRKLLRAANDWTCDLPSLARKAQIKQEKAYDTVAKAVANGDLPNAAISDDYSTLYLDDSLCPAGTPAPQAAPVQTLTDAEQFNRDGVDFFELSKNLPWQAGYPDGRRTEPGCRRPARRFWASCIITPSSCPGCAASASITCPPPASCWTRRKG